jgi:hypothetical protein
MKNFGCLRNFWEGGYMGERSILQLKKSLPHGAHLDGSMRTAIRRYFIDVVLKQLIDNEHVNKKTHFHNVVIDESDPINEERFNNNENYTHKNYDRYRRFRVYKSLESLNECMATSKPISLVFDDISRCFYVLIWKCHMLKRIRTMHLIDFRGGRVLEGCYMKKRDELLKYCNDNDNGDVPCVPLDIEKMTQLVSCIALPYHIYNENNVTIHYYVRTEKHLELRKIKDTENMMMPVFSFQIPTLYINEGTKE